MAKLRKSEHPGLIFLIFDMYNVCTKSFFYENKTKVCRFVVFL
jgi:hypothetical protein